MPAELPDPVGLGTFARHRGGLIRHRMPLRRELSPFLFGDSVGCALGLLLTSNRFQVVFLSQAKIS
jgi:hypothetical protein